MQTPPKIACPACGSDQFHAGKKGFSGKKAAAGAVLTGGIGLLAGTIGSNKIELTCLACGNKWRPEAVEPEKKAFQATLGTRRVNKTVLIVFLVLMALIVLICCL